MLQLKCHVTCFSATAMFFCVFRVRQGIRPLLPLPEGLYWPVDGLLLSTSGGHRCQLACLLHHTLHRGSFCCTDLHYLHLWGPGETTSPGGALPHQQEQQPSETHIVLVRTFWLQAMHGVLNAAHLLTRAQVFCCIKKRQMVQHCSGHAVHFFSDMDCALWWIIPCWVCVRMDHRALSWLVAMSSQKLLLWVSILV